MIARGELHLSGVHQLAGHLSEENHEEVLRRAKHKSMREIELPTPALALSPTLPLTLALPPTLGLALPLALTLAPTLTRTRPPTLALTLPLTLLRTATTTQEDGSGWAAQGVGGEPPPCFDVQSRASGYPATEHARRELSSGDSVAQHSCCR